MPPIAGLEDWRNIGDKFTDFFSGVKSDESDYSQEIESPKFQFHKVPSFINVYCTFLLGYSILGGNCGGQDSDS